MAVRSSAGEHPGGRIRSAVEIQRKVIALLPSTDNDRPGVREEIVGRLAEYEAALETAPDKLR